MRTSENLEIDAPIERAKPCDDDALTFLGS